MTTPTEPPQRIDLPRDGYSLYFKPESHAYHRVNDRGLVGLRMPGASTVAKAFPDSPDGLMRWVERLTLEGTSRLAMALAKDRKPEAVVEELGYWHDPHGLRARLEAKGLRWEQIRDAAGRRGTDIHVKMLEALARGDEPPDLDELDEEHRGYGQAVFRWWQARKPEPLQVEQVIYSRDHNYAGRLDLRCEIEAPMQPLHGTGIIDLKTSRFVGRKDHIQLRLYEIGSEECGIGGADWCMVLQARPDGKYIERMCAATRDDALCAVDAYARAKAVDKRMEGAQ